LQEKYGDLSGKKIAALGLAYKPNVDDLRESPAIEVVKILLQAGAVVSVFEPFDIEFSIPGAASHAQLADAVKNADIILLLVPHTQLTDLKPSEIQALTPKASIFDSVHGWDMQEWRTAGFTYHRLGDGKN
jgi:UDP-glucose 6-dehydrogenase